MIINWVCLCCRRKWRWIMWRSTSSVWQTSVSTLAYAGPWRPSEVSRYQFTLLYNQLYIPRSKLNLDKRAFSVAAPDVWNKLPVKLKYCENLASVHKNLETYFLPWIVGGPLNWWWLPYVPGTWIWLTILFCCASELGPPRIEAL